MLKREGLAVGIGIILALLGVIVAIVQLRQSQQASGNQDSAQNTQIAILNEQLLVQREMATLQAGASGSNSNATVVAERVAQLQNTAIALSTQQSKLGAGLLFEDNFEDGIADGWNGKGGNWTVVYDENGNYVYPGNANSGGWAYAIPSGASFEWKNFAIETRWRVITVSSQTDDNFADGQVTFRIKYDKPSGCSYYGVFFDTVQDFMSLARQGFNKDCEWAVLTDHKYALESGRWYKLRIETKGTIHKAYVDGNLFLEANDNSVVQGAFEIDAAPGGVVQFDDVKVWALGD
jgi:hypothetical protein